MRSFTQLQTAVTRACPAGVPQNSRWARRSSRSDSQKREGQRCGSTSGGSSAGGGLRDLAGLHDMGR